MTQKTAIQQRVEERIDEIEHWQFATVEEVARDADAPRNVVTAAVKCRENVFLHQLGAEEVLAKRVRGWPVDE